MANKIYVQLIGTNIIFDSPLMEDITLTCQSGFATFGDLVPGISDVVHTVTSLMSGVSGKVGEGMLKINNAFDLPRWQKTEPLKINAKMNFFTKTDPYKDVWYPMALLTSLGILTKDVESNTYITPGMSLHAANFIEKSKILRSPIAANLGLTETIPEAGDFPVSAKVISVEIPGIVYLDKAYVEVATPTYSRHITTSGLPLWGTLDIQISSLFPANDRMFRDATEYIVDGEATQFAKLRNENALKSAAKSTGGMG